MSNCQHESDLGEMRDIMREILPPTKPMTLSATQK